MHGVAENVPLNVAKYHFRQVTESRFYVKIKNYESLHENYFLPADIGRCFGELQK